MANGHIITYDDDLNFQAAAVYLNTGANGYLTMKDGLTELIDSVANLRMSWLLW